MISPRETFGIYLEGSGPGIRAERFRRMVGESSFAAARETWSGRIHGPMIERAVVEAALGPPDNLDEANDNTLSYLIPQRPGYAYTFQFELVSGFLMTAEFRRLGPSPTLPPRPNTPSEVTEYRSALTQLGVTRSEILDCLGPPIHSDGWWPIETWEYPGDLILNLRHGVVEDA